MMTASKYENTLLPIRDRSYKQCVHLILPSQLEIVRYILGAKYVS